MTTGDANSSHLDIFLIGVKTHRAHQFREKARGCSSIVQFPNSHCIITSLLNCCMRSVGLNHLEARERERERISSYYWSTIAVLTLDGTFRCLSRQLDGYSCVGFFAQLVTRRDWAASLMKPHCDCVEMLKAVHIIQAPSENWDV